MDTTNFTNRQHILRHSLWKILDELNISSRHGDDVQPKVDADTDIIYPYISETDPCRLAYLSDKKVPSEILVYDNNQAPVMSTALGRIQRLQDMKSQGTFGKVGKTLNRCFENIPQGLIEEIANRLGARSNNSEFVPVDERLPSEIYSIRTDSNAGTLCSSCMRPESDGEKERFEVYDNDAYGLHCEFTEINGEERLKGRALIWQVDFHGDERFFVDRIYGTEYFKKSVIQYWEAKNALIRIGDGYEWQGFIDPITGGTSYCISVKSSCDYEHAPYMDSFKDYNGSELITAESGPLTQCDGTGFGRSHCEHCGDDVEQDDMVYVESVGNCCDDCAVWTEDEAQLRENCVRIEGNWYCEASESIVYSGHDEEHILVDNAIYIDSINSYVRLENSTFCEHSQTDELSSNCVQLENGDWLEEDHEDLVKIGESYYIEGIEDEEIEEARIEDRARQCRLRSKHILRNVEARQKDAYLKRHKSDLEFYTPSKNPTYAYFKSLTFDERLSINRDYHNAGPLFQKAIKAKLLTRAMLFDKSRFAVYTPPVLSKEAISSLSSFVNSLMEGQRHNARITNSDVLAQWRSPQLTSSDVLGQRHDDVLDSTAYAISQQF